MAVTKVTLLLSADGVKDEYAVEVPGATHPPEFTRRIQQEAQRFVAKAGLTVPRNSQTPVKVFAARLEVKDGKLARIPFAPVYVVPPLAPMNQEEYETELEGAVAKLPPEIAEFVKQYVYEDGHSAGREEVVCLARNMAATLVPAVEAYTARIKKG